MPAYHGCMFLSIINVHSECDHVLSDNGPQYKSDEINKFLKANGIKHSYTTPYYPATNIAAGN